jgi:hypothetical protein
VETGVQLRDNEMNLLDSRAWPGPDPGIAGMTKKGNFEFFTVSSMNRKARFDPDFDSL